MPAAKRRKVSGGPPTKASQSTLTFQSKKATRSSPGKEEKVVKPEKVEIEGQEDGLVELRREEEPKREEIEASEGPALDDEEVEELRLDTLARALTESKIKSYWAAKKRDRKAPRVHQQGLGVREMILREFDMSSRFGPCVGITRLARWRRAKSLGMDPPIEILAVLLKEGDDVKKEGQQKGKRDYQMSIIDELTLSSRLKGDELET